MHLSIKRHQPGLTEVIHSCEEIQQQHGTAVKKAKSEIMKNPKKQLLIIIKSYQKLKNI